MTSEWDREHLWRYRARVLRVIDGDTVVVECDTGFWGRQEVHVRLARVMARELHERGGHADRDRLMHALAQAEGEWPLRVVTLQRDASAREVTSFERYVAELYHADGATSINDAAMPAEPGGVGAER